MTGWHTASDPLTDGLNILLKPHICKYSHKPGASLDWLYQWTSTSSKRVADVNKDEDGQVTVANYWSVMDNFISSSILSG